MSVVSSGSEMSRRTAFASCVCVGERVFFRGKELRTCPAPPIPRQCIRTRARMVPKADATPPNPEEIAREEQARKLESMRARLEGLFGADEDDIQTIDVEDFDGTALRNTIQGRWGVQFDVQPQKRHGRVYVQVMWRYFEQQSFYMQEDEFACHCEAVAQLLQKWDAVDYFCDYVASIKKRPVVGIAVNIPIPGVDADTASFE